jgi:hypothetical protein
VVAVDGSDKMVSKSPGNGPKSMLFAAAAWNKNSIIVSGSRGKLYGKDLEVMFFPPPADIAGFKSG